jgi:hypothetical protein
MDRASELVAGPLDRLIDAVRAGESGALVVRGDPGVGKTALLGHLTGRASGFAVPGRARGSPGWCPGLTGSKRFTTLKRECV